VQKLVTKKITTTISIQRSIFNYGNRSAKTTGIGIPFQGKAWQIEVIPTKEAKTQRDLSLAYSPGVAAPCLEIAANPEDVYKYTARETSLA